eukprot:6152702-Pyramimonas_sp.AAC.1
MEEARVYIVLTADQSGPYQRGEDGVEGGRTANRPSQEVHPPSLAVHPPSLAVHLPSRAVHPPSQAVHPPSQA